MVAYILRCHVERREEKREGMAPQYQLHRNRSVRLILEYIRPQKTEQDRQLSNMD